MRLFQTIYYSISIAFIACLLNGILCGLYLMLFFDRTHFFEAAFLVIVFSGLFGLLGAVPFWFCLFIGIRRNHHFPSFFNFLLLTTVIIACCTSAAFLYFLGDMAPVPVQIVLFVAATSAVLSLFLHRSLIMAFFHIVNKSSYV